MCFHEMSHASGKGTVNVKSSVSVITVHTGMADEKWERGWHMHQQHLQVETKALASSVERRGRQREKKGGLEAAQRYDPHAEDVAQQKQQVYSRCSPLILPANPGAFDCTFC